MSAHRHPSRFSLVATPEPRRHLRGLMLGLLVVSLALQQQSAAQGGARIALPEAPPRHPAASPGSHCGGQVETIPDVFLHSGELHLEAVDLTIAGRGLDFVWQRCYRSRIGPDTAQGHGWDHSYNLSVAAEGTGVRLMDGNGRSDVYRRRDDGSFAALQFHREGRFDSTQRFVLSFPDQGVWTFLPIDGSPQSGRIETIADRNGNALQFRYDAAGQLIAIVDTLGRVIGLSYRPDGRLSHLTDFVGRRVVYDYYGVSEAGGSDGDLKSARSPTVVGTPNGNDYPAGKTTTYTYTTGHADPELNHNLLTVTDPSGQTWMRNTYAPSTNPSSLLFDRLIRQQRGDPGDVIDITYEYGVSGVVPAITDRKPPVALLLAVVNDRMGNVSEYRYDGLGRCRSRRNYTGRANPTQPTTRTTNRPGPALRAGDPPLFETTWTHNVDSLVTRVGHPNGNLTDLVYELELNPAAPWRSRGNLRERYQRPGTHTPAGSQVVITERFEYDAEHGACCGTNFVTKHTDARGNVTQHSYDARGNRIRTIHRIPTIVEDFTYNQFGQLVQHVWPDNGSGYRQTDTRTYYASTAGNQYGYLQSETVDSAKLALTTSWIYDPVGNAVAMTDPRGSRSLMVVNELNQVVRTTSPQVRMLNSKTASYEVDTWFDANDNVVRLDTTNVDSDGKLGANTHFTTTYSYEILNHRVREQQEVDQTTTVATEFAYDKNRNLTLTRSGPAVSGAQPANVVARLYDERDLLFRTTRGAGGTNPSTTQHDYDGNQQLSAMFEGTEGTPQVTLHTYDAYGREVATTDAMGNTATRDYDPNSNTIHVRFEGELCDLAGGGANVRLYEVRYQYDAMDRLVETNAEHFDPATQAPIGDGVSTTKVRWTDRSEQAAITDDNGHTTLFTYDCANRRKLLSDALGNSVEASYDENGNVVSLTETEIPDTGGRALVFRTTSTYDSLDRQTAEIDPLGNINGFGYDSRDNLSQMVDALGNATRMTHDGLQRLRTSTRFMTDDGTGEWELVGTIVRSWDWDDGTRLIKRVDDNCHATAHSYDDLNRVIETKYADGTTETFTYDVHDNIVIKTDPNGTVITSTYDLLDRLIGRTLQLSPGVSGDTTFERWKHDGQSRIVHAEDDDSIVTFAHDSLSGVTSETQNGAAFQCVYDGVGNELSRSYPGGKVVRRTYDALNRIRSIDNAGLAATYLYIGPRRIERRDTGAGIATSVHAYDGARRLIRLDHLREYTELDRRTFQWDGMYNKTQAAQVSSTAPQSMFDYSYDSNYRLVDSLVRDGSGLTLRANTYVLDGVGNRTRLDGGPCAGPYVMDPTLPEPADAQMNQYTNTPCIGCIEYDSNGNEVREGTTVFMAYDYRNQLVEHLDAGRTRYSYDAFGRRIGTVDPTGATTLYYYAGREVVEERAGVKRTEYVRGVDGEIVEMTRGGVRYFFFNDDMGSTRIVTDKDGNPVERYEYEDYGAPTFFRGATQLTGSAIGNSFLFTGQQYDPESGLYYYKTRHFDPRIGRFISRDLLGLWGDANNLGNGRTYVGNNPQTLVDPLGMVAGSKTCGGRWPGTVYYNRLFCGSGNQVPDALCGAMRGAGRADRAAGPWLTYEFNGYPGNWSWLLGVPFKEYFGGPDGSLSDYQKVSLWLNLRFMWSPFQASRPFDIYCNFLPYGLCAGNTNAYYKGGSSIAVCGNKWLSRSAKRRSAILLHELTHKILNTNDYFYYSAFDRSSNEVALGAISVPLFGSTQLLLALSSNNFETGKLLRNADTYEAMYHKWFMR